MKKFTNYIDHNINEKIELKDKHLFICGKNNIDNYKYSLNYLKNQSTSELKYSRKFNITYNSNEYYFNISDVHIEIDFELLGVNEYNLFFEIYNHVIDNIVSNKCEFYILCLHFNNIKAELHDVFSSILNNSKVKFIFLSTQLSFINKIIMDKVLVKKIKTNEISKYSYTYDNTVNKLSEMIIAQNKNLFSLREVAYNILIFNYKVHDCFALLIQKLIDKQYLNNDNIDDVMCNYIHFIEYFNNNYRTIYHLEKFITYLINLKNN